MVASLPGRALLSPALCRATCSSSRAVMFLNALFSVLIAVALVSRSGWPGLISRELCLFSFLLVLLFKSKHSASPFFRNVAKESATQQRLIN